MENAAIAEVLFELADLYEVTRAPAYTARAFRTAGRAIESLAQPAGELLRQGRLTEVPGVGAGTARRVAELVETGGLLELERLRGRAPRGLVDLLRIDGLGASGAEKVWRALGISDLAALEAAAREGRLRTLPRWSEKKEAKILRGIAAYRRRQGRLRLSRATPIATALLAQARQLPGVQRVELAGDFRRRKDAIDAVDLVLAARPDATNGIAAAAFAALPQLRDVERTSDAAGGERVRARLREGLAVSVHVVRPERFGAAWHAATGAPAHVAAVHALAGETLNRSDLFDEGAVFAAAGLPAIPPELREGAGEIEAARAGRLPRLLTGADLRGDLHMHTTETDGRATLEDMVAAAAALGHEYIAITDHSQALAFTRGLDPERLARQGRAIRALNDARAAPPFVLRGIEADILPDGSVDLGAEILGELDWVVASVHSRFGLPRAEQTRRVVAALESGVVDVLGHPTGRIIAHREPYPIDLEAVFAAARRAGAAVELNAYPDRLDLCDTHLRLAKEMGVAVVLSTDSHATRHLAHAHFGVDTARRGWLEPADVANTLPLKAFVDRFRHHHRKGH